MAVDVLGPRVLSVAYAQAYPVTTTDTLVPLAVQRSGSAVIAAATTALVVPTGKTFRLNAITGAIVLAGTTVSTTRFFLRYQLGGNVTVTSPIAATWRMGGNSAIASHVYPFDQDFTEGMEFPAGCGVGVSAIATAATQHTLDIDLIGFDYTA